MFRTAAGFIQEPPPVPRVGGSGFRPRESERGRILFPLQASTVTRELIFRKKDRFFADFATGIRGIQAKSDRVAVAEAGSQSACLQKIFLTSRAHPERGMGGGLFA